MNRRGIRLVAVYIVAVIAVSALFAALVFVSLPEGSPVTLRQCAVGGVLMAFCFSSPVIAYVAIGAMSGGWKPLDGGGGEGGDPVGDVGERAPGVEETR